MSHKVEEGTLARRIATLELVFPQGVLGFESHHSFELSALGTTFGPYRMLKSQTFGGPSFVVVQPCEVGLSVEFDVDSTYEALLGIESSGDVVVLLIVTPQGRYEPVEANLAAPIVVNIRTLRAAQIAQLQRNYPIAHALDIPLVDLTR